VDAIKRKIPWQQQRPSRQLIRLKPEGYPENPVLSRIRDEEIRNPAPFGNKTLIMQTNHFEKFDYPPGFNAKPKYLVGNGSYVDIPIRRIAGVLLGNLYEYEPGMTFREVLFNCLHGLHFNEDSIEFLMSDEPKNDPPPYNRAFKHHGGTPRGGIGFSKYGDWFLVNQGTQRVLLSMFAIYQRDGIEGTLKNVPTSG